MTPGDGTLAPIRWAVCDTVAPSAPPSS